MPNTLELVLPAGNTEIRDRRLGKALSGSLAAMLTEVLMVKVEGTCYDLVTTAPGNRQCKHDRIFGRLIFSEATPEDRSVFVLTKNVIE